MRKLLVVICLLLSFNANAKEIYLHQKTEYVSQQLKNTAGIGIKVDDIDFKTGIIYQSTPTKKIVMD